MDEPQAGLALFLNVVMPLLFYIASQWAMLKVAKRAQKTLQYRFMLINLMVINAIVLITSAREMLLYPEQLFTYVVYGVYVAILTYPSIVAIESKMKRRTIKLLIGGSLFVTIAFGSLIYRFTLYLIIPISFFSLGLFIWIVGFGFKGQLSKLKFW